MKKIIYCLIILSVLCFCGCGQTQEGAKESAQKKVEDTKNTHEGTEVSKEVVETTPVPEVEESIEGEIGTGDQNVGENDIAEKTEEEVQSNADMNTVSDFCFADISDLEFFFSSGAGGWWTEMYIHEDGSFEGIYRDGNMGITGEDYPNGQMYYSSFNGKFTEPEMIDEYTYMCRLEFMEYDRCEGSEIIDGVKIDYTTAYGLDGGDTFCFYLPGKAWQELPEDFRSWVGGEFIWRYEGDVHAEESILPFYGLFNLEEGCGFSSYEIEQ